MFYPRSAIISIFLCLCILSLAGSVCAVPVFSDSLKNRVTAETIASTAKFGTVLGKYHDIRVVKKRNAQSVQKEKTRAKELLSSISARCAIIIDAVSGRTLFSKNADKERQPASTIKVLTGMIALTTLKRNETVPVSIKAARQPRSKIYLDHRKRYPAPDLINAVLLASANDASVALAEKIAGSEKSFARLMTRYARRWGAKNTICKTATGLTAKGQKSTARDLAIILRHAMKNKDFARTMKHTTVRTSDGKILRNHNRALWQVKGTQGGKTGYTNAARQTYVGKFKRGYDEIVIAILGSESMWADLEKLVEFGFDVQEIARVERAEIIMVAEAGT